MKRVAALLQERVVVLAWEGGMQEETAQVQAEPRGMAQGGWHPMYLLCSSLGGTTKSDAGQCRPSHRAPQPPPPLPYHPAQQQQRGLREQQACLRLPYHPARQLQQGLLEQQACLRLPYHPARQLQQGLLEQA